MTDIFDECIELAGRLALPYLDHKITLDEAREMVLVQCPSWRNGGQAMQIINNVAVAYKVRQHVEFNRR